MPGNLRRIARGCLPLVLLVLCGCGHRAVVSGRVTVNGKDIEKGFITFFPADGKGNTNGGQIVRGAYTVTGLEPGKKRVLITSEPEAVVIPATGTERARVALLPGKTPVGANVAGNNRVVEVAPGGQTLDFALGWSR